MLPLVVHQTLSVGGVAVAAAASLTWTSLVPFLGSNFAQAGGGVPEVRASALWLPCAMPPLFVIAAHAPPHTAHAVFVRRAPGAHSTQSPPASSIGGEAS